MSNYKGHLCGGVAAYCLLLLCIFFVCGISFLAIPNLCLYLCCTLFGALFPDVDTKSRGQRYFYQLLSIVLIFYVLKGHFIAVTVCALLAIAPLLGRHRGLFHEAWFLVAMTVGIVAGLQKTKICSQSTLWCAALFFLAGAFSHLILDFWPYLFKKRAWKRKW